MSTTPPAAAASATPSTPTSPPLPVLLTLPRLTLLSTAFIHQLQTPTTNATAVEQIDQLFQQKQTEYLQQQLDGNVVPSPTGFEALLHELCWISTFTHADGPFKVASADVPAEVTFNLTLRGHLVEVVKRNLTSSSDANRPSTSQIALVDVLWLIWSELDQIKRVAASVNFQCYEELRDRFVAFTNELAASRQTITTPTTDSTNESSSSSSFVSLLPARSIRETFQPEFLEIMSVYSAKSVEKQMMLLRTSIWYRQQKFNLLREETEGFAKLFTELTTFFLLPQQQVSIDLLIKKVEAFIGFFDLDPNRVIDIILDAFEKSALTASTSQLGNFLRLIDLFQKGNVLQILGFKFRNYYDQYVQAQLSGAKVTSCIGVAPQSLYDIAAVLIKTGRIQLEGLYPHLSPSDDLMSVARSDLIAEEKRKLAKMNVVSLSKGGDDEKEEMKRPEMKKSASSQQLSSVASKDRNEQGILSAGGSNEKKEEISLVLTGAPIPSLQLEIEKPTPPPPPTSAPTKTETMPPPPAKVSIRGTIIPTPTKKEEPTPIAPPPPTASPPPPVPNHPNQKFHLIAALINQNAWNYADILLNHLVGLNPAANPACGGALVEFINRMLRPLYVPIAAEHRRFAQPKPKTNPNTGVSAKEDFSHSVDALPPTSDPSATYFNWTLLSEAQVEEQFSEPLPLATYHAALPTICRVLKYLSIYLCNDVSLWSRLCRVLSYILRQERKQLRRAISSGESKEDAPSSVEPSQMIEDLIADILIPAFALLPSCHGNSEEMWSVLKQLPYELRYRLYGYWHQNLYEAYPEMMVLKASVLYRAKYFRKRIAAARVKECSRLMVKFAENNAILVFELLLQQIQSFDNMINPVTECMKLLHPLAFDCVAFVLLQQLSTNKPKLSDDGINETHWLQSLATFAGVFFQRYPEVEITPIIQFVFNQLKNEQSLDLLVLKDIMVGMSNIEIHEEVSEQEMDGRAGGKVIQTETTTIRDKNKNKGKPTKILCDTILRNRLTLPLWVTIAQQKNQITYHYDSEHLKLISELYDKCHEALLHLTAFVDQTISEDSKYAGQFCSLEELVVDYHIKPADAFHALRRVLQDKKMQCKEVEEETPIKEENGMEIDMEEKKGGEAEDTTMTDANETVVKKEPDTSSTTTISPYASLIACVQNFLPDTVWKTMTPTFYTLFWRLQLSNLHVPKATYENHIAKLKSLIPALDSPTTGGSSSTAGVPKTELQKKQSRMEKDRINKTITALQDELKQQTKDVDLFYKELEQEKTKWFDSSITSPKDSMASFLQFCILPRVLHSGIDAHYTAKFIITIVKMNTPHFAYIDLFDQLFKCIGPLISSCSVNEASRFGRFLKEVLHELHKFAYNEEKYQQVIKKSPNCFMKVGTTATDSLPGVPFTFAHISMEVKKFHLRLSKIFGRTLSAAAGATKMEINNALLLLCKIGTEWPRTVSQGVKIESLLEVIMNLEENKNTSLKLMSTRSHAQLQTTKKTWIQDIPLPQPKQSATSSSTADKDKDAKRPASSATSTSAAKPPATGSTTKPPTSAPSTSTKPSTSTTSKPSATPSKSSDSKPSTTTSSSSVRSSPAPSSSSRESSQPRGSSGRDSGRDSGRGRSPPPSSSRDSRDSRDRDPKAEQRAFQEKEKQQQQQASNGRDRDQRDSKDSRPPPAPAKDSKDTRDSKDSRSSKDTKDTRDSSKDTRPSSSTTASAKDTKDSCGRSPPKSTSSTASSSNKKLNANAREFTPSPAKPPVDNDRIRERAPSTTTSNSRPPTAPTSSNPSSTNDKRNTDSSSSNRRDDNKRTSPPRSDSRNDNRDKDRVNDRSNDSRRPDDRSSSDSKGGRSDSSARRDEPKSSRDNPSTPTVSSRGGVKDELIRGVSGQSNSDRDRDRDRDRRDSRPPPAPASNNSTSSTKPTVPPISSSTTDRKRKREDDKDDTRTPTTPATPVTSSQPQRDDRSSTTHSSNNNRHDDNNRQQKRPRGDDPRDSPNTTQSHQQRYPSNSRGGGYQRSSPPPTVNPFGAIDPSSASSFGAIPQFQFGPSNLNQQYQQQLRMLQQQQLQARANQMFRSGAAFQQLQPQQQQQQQQQAHQPFTYGGVAPLNQSNPFNLGNGLAAANGSTSSLELEDTDFATLSSLLVPTLPLGHPALLFLEETPRRNFTAKIRTLLKSIRSVVSPDPTDELLVPLRESFEIIRTIFSSESDEGMKLQLDQSIDPSKPGHAIDIKSTFLGLILYCLNQYPWLNPVSGRSHCLPSAKSPTPPNAVPSATPTNPFVQEQLRLAQQQLAVSQAVQQVMQQAQQRSGPTQSNEAVTNLAVNYMAAMNAANRGPNATANTMINPNMSYPDMNTMMFMNNVSAMNNPNLLTSTAQAYSPFSHPPVNQPTITNSANTLNGSTTVGVSSSSTIRSLLSSEVSDELNVLIRIILGLQKNLMKYGFQLSHTSSNRSTTPYSANEIYMSNILSLCILQFHRSPLTGLIQPMADLFQILIKAQPTPSPRLSLPSASSISISSAIPDESTVVGGGSSAELDEAFLRLFQQNPQMTKELLPFIRLFGKSGTKPRQITSSIHLLQHDPLDDRRLNIWIYFTFWLTLEKVEFLIRWLLEESNLSDLYDPNYRLDFGDGHGSQTILAYVTRIKGQQPNRAPIQLYHQLLTHLSTVLGGSPSTAQIGGVGVGSGVDPSLDEELASSLAELSTSSVTSSTSSSSVVSAKGDHRSSVRDRTKNHSYLVQSQVRVCDVSSFRSWLEDALEHITSPRSYISARLLERLTAPVRLTSSSPRFGSGHKPSGPELTPLHQTNLHEAVSELIVVLREQSDSLNLLEEDVYGNILFHSILALPTNELIRLKVVEATLFKLIDSLPAAIMTDFRLVLESQSRTIVNEVYDETILFNMTGVTPQFSPLNNFTGGHRIYPIFNEGTIRLEVTGMQFWWRSDDATASPTLQLWDCASKTILGTADFSRTPLINNAMNRAEFDPPIVLTESQSTTGVLSTLFFPSGQLAYVNATSFHSVLNLHPDYRFDPDAAYQSGAGAFGGPASISTPNHYPTLQQGPSLYYLVAPIVRRVSVPSGQILLPNSSNKNVPSSVSKTVPASHLPGPATGAPSIPITFLSAFSDNLSRSGVGEAPPGSEVGILIDFQTDGYVYGLKMRELAELQTHWGTFNSHSLKFWRYVEDKPTLLTQVKVNVDPSQPWCYGWFESPIRVRGRFLMSFDVSASGSYTLWPRSEYTPRPNEFVLVGGRMGPSGTFPVTPCSIPAIDLLFSTTPPNSSPNTTNSTESTIPFSFSLDSAFTMGSTVNPFNTKLESKENNETRSTTSSSSSSIGTGLESIAPNFTFTAPVKKEYVRLTGDLLYGSAIPSQQVNDSGHVIHIIGNSTSAPLDLLFTRHSPYPQGEFIYQLFERLLNKAIPNNLSLTEMIAFIDNGSVANFHRILAQFPQMEISELRVWLNLFQRHSIHSTSKLTVMDIFAPWIRSGDLGRIREWFMENHSTDALWPTRTSGIDHAKVIPLSLLNESLLDMANRIHGETAGPNNTNIQAIVKYLETQRDRWYDLYLPLIRINITEQLIPDLAEIVCDYLIPSKYPKLAANLELTIPSSLLSSTEVDSPGAPNKRLRMTTSSAHTQLNQVADVDAYGSNESMSGTKRKKARAVPIP